MSNRINFLPPWVETNMQPAFYDKESGTCLQQTARMYAKVNQLVRIANEQWETIANYIQQFINLKDFVEDYFDNLDVQEEINKKLDEMAEDGSLLAIIAPYVNNYVDPLFDAQDEILDGFNTRLVNQDTAIDALNARVSDIASLTEGSTTGDAELLDIRVGFDGTTYDSAGDAVRHADAFNAKYIFATHTIVFSQGGITASTGETNSSNSRIRSTSYLPSDTVRIQALSGYKYAIYVWDSDNVYQGCLQSNGTIAKQTAVFLTGSYYPQTLLASYQIKVVVAKSNGTDNIAPSDASNFVTYTSKVDNYNNLVEYLYDSCITAIDAGYVQGSVDVTTGTETTRNDRCRSKLLPKSTVSINVENGYRFMLYAYDSNGAYVGCYNPSTNTYQTSTYVFTTSKDITGIYKYGEYYFRIIACPPTGVSTITPAQATSNIVAKANIVLSDADELEKLKEGYIDSIPNLTSCVIDYSSDIQYSTGTGCCIVTHNDITELWCFTTSDDTDTSDYNKCDKYIYDPSTGQLSFKETIQHNLGHVNSVAYCEATDTLICGNGSGDYELTGAIYILEGAYGKLSLERSDCINIPFTTYGTKVNCVWGDSNFGEYDIAYVLTNDTHDIYKIQLGKTTHDLGNGTIISGANGFNATYKIMNHWTWGTLKAEYPVVAQGATFCSNKLVWGYGHNVGKVAVKYAKLYDDGRADFGGINYVNYNNNGTAGRNYPCGVSTYNDKLIVTNSSKCYTVDLNKSIA